MPKLHDTCQILLEELLHYSESNFLANLELILLDLKTRRRDAAIIEKHLTLLAKEQLYTYRTESKDYSNKTEYEKKYMQTRSLEIARSIFPSDTEIDKL